MKNLEIIKKYLFLIIIIFISLHIVIFFNSADWDLWARLAAGKIFFQTGHVLQHDIFAYTQTKDLWIDHEWGSGAIFYIFSHYFGDMGLIALKFFSLLFIVILAFNTNQLRSNGDNPYKVSYYIILLFGLLTAFSYTLRSQSFTYLFFALWIYLLDKVRLGNNRLIWLFPATMLVWANVHGGFLAGLGIVALYGIGEAINRRSCIKYFGILASSTLVTLINPYGLKYWAYLIDAITMPRPFVKEWGPLDLFGPINESLCFKILLVFVILSFIYLLAKRFKEINWSEILILAATFYMAIKHVRHQIFFIIAASSYIYYYLYPAFDWCTFDTFRNIKEIFNRKLKYLSKGFEILFYSILIIISLLNISFLPLKIKVNEKQFPAKAVKFIQINKLSGNLLVLFNWGGYALWKLYPQCLIAVDGRYEEVYTPQTMDEISRFHYLGVHWNELLQKYHTDLILVPIEYDVYNNLLKLPDWKLIYKDDQAAIFIPASKSQRKWLEPSANFDPEKEKYDTGIDF